MFVKGRSIFLQLFESHLKIVNQWKSGSQILTWSVCSWRSIPWSW